MTTYFDLPLWIDFDDIMNRAAYFKDDLSKFDSDIQDAILQWVHDQLYLPADAGVPIVFKDNSTGGSPGSSQFPLALLRQLQISLGAWAAAFTIDNPAGTGSLSGVSIDAFSVSNTMAKNNATAEDLINANQYGSQAYAIWSQRPQTRIFI
jgi:hypothetical protein